jgi:D-3-phosphoglycerate dehydrogenase
VAIGNWDRNLFIGKELSGKTLGIVGLGRLGSMMARYGVAFGVHVMATDPSPSCGVPEGVEMASFDKLLSESDIVSVHVDLNPTTQSIFGEREFGQMKPGAIFVNTSRGEVVDEIALLSALERGHLYGAGLDVRCNEFAGVSALNSGLIAYAQHHDNLVITPHIGGATADSMKKADQRIIEKLLDIIR